MNKKEGINHLFNQNNHSLLKTDPEWVKFVSHFMQDDVESLNTLSFRDRMLCILSVLLGCQGMGAYANMLRVAFKGGLDPIAIKETVYQATAYLGVGRTYDFLLKTNEIMTEQGISLPLEDQSTSNQETRFDMGLAKQVALFGVQMAERQKDTGPRRHINQWLASNCFGDYYTRKGLNDQEREMITFCFLLSQGGCENQLRGHVQGNFNVGNDQKKLYQVVEQCMPYIGYPRSLNAMGIIDEISRKQKEE